MEKLIAERFSTISENFIKIQNLSSTIATVVQVCINSLKNNNKIMFCGNGGSAADAQHLAAELLCRYKIERKPFNAIALTTDTSILTSIANDFDYDSIFERQIEGIGKTGDILFCISTSGKSENVLRALNKAKSMNIKTIAMTGKNQTELSKNADFAINVPSNITNNIQEMHIAVGHIICEIIEKELVEQGV